MTSETLILLFPSWLWNSLSMTMFGSQYSSTVRQAILMKMLSSTAYNSIYKKSLYCEHPDFRKYTFRNKEILKKKKKKGAVLLER